jgi:glucose-1-phosphatase
MARRPCEIHHGSREARRQKVDFLGKEMNKPELIIFDLGRVLVDFDFKKVVRELKKHTSFSEKEIRHYFETTPLWDAFERGVVRPRPFFKQISTDLHLKDLRFDVFKPFWNDIFTVKEDTLAVVEKLRGHYRLAILSNVNEMHWNHIKEKHAFMAWFDHPIASYAVGLRKPEHAIYHKALEIAGGIHPSKAIFFDDLETHILGAREAGLRAHQFTTAAQLIKDLEGLL